MGGLAAKAACVRFARILYKAPNRKSQQITCVHDGNVYNFCPANFGRQTRLGVDIQQRHQKPDKPRPWRSLWRSGGIASAFD